MNNPKKKHRLNKKNNLFNNKEILMHIISIFFIISAFISVSYSSFVWNSSSNNEQTIVAGNFSLTMDDSSPTLGGLISIPSAYPLSDSEGMALEPYKFKIQNNGNVPLNFNITIINDQSIIDSELCSSNLISDSDVKFKLGGDSVTTPTLLTSLNNNSIISGKLYPNEIRTYSLNVWIKSDSTNDLIGKHFHKKLKVDSEQFTFYTDNSGANYPEIFTGMIPVYYDEVNSVWKKANIVKNWYDYNLGKWANVVTVGNTGSGTGSDGVTRHDRSYYLNATTEVPISMDDINTMLVWVPRYKYKLWNAQSGISNEQVIDIEFERVSTEKSNGGSIDNGLTGINGDFLTHPSFTFGNSELPGFWVSKFEITNTIDQIQSKPGVIPVRNQILSNLFYGIRNMELGNNIYGFNQTSSVTNTTGSDGIILNDSNNLDTHMIKNTEWGAVSYLSHSKYGRCGTYSSTCEVWINPSSTYITGQVGTSADASVTPTTNSYNNNPSQAESSTTRNIYGVYDMSGGMWEYVMGNMVDLNGNFSTSSSGFSVTPNMKYYNSYLYDASSNLTYNRGLLGDATKETIKIPSTLTGGWYTDNSYFPFDINSWFIRGGYSSDSVNSGLYSFNYRNGGISSSRTTRFIISNN